MFGSHFTLEGFGKQQLPFPLPRGEEGKVTVLILSQQPAARRLVLSLPNLGAGRGREYRAEAEVMTRVTEPIQPLLNNSWKNSLAPIGFIFLPNLGHTYLFIFISGH